MFHAKYETGVRLHTPPRVETETPQTHTHHRFAPAARLCVCSSSTLADSRTAMITECCRDHIVTHTQKWEINASTTPYIATGLINTRVIIHKIHCTSYWLLMHTWYIPYICPIIGGPIYWPVWWLCLMSASRVHTTGAYLLYYILCIGALYTLSDVCCGCARVCNETCVRFVVVQQQQQQRTRERCRCCFMLPNRITSHQPPIDEKNGATT